VRITVATAARRPLTASTPTTLPRNRTHRSDDVALVLVELDILDDGLLDPENRSP
jgi:hypothetical protein